MDRTLPDIGTIEEAKVKLQQSYLSFLDSAAKFVTISQYYSEQVNKGRALPVTFKDSYIKNLNKLKTLSPDDFGYELSIFTMLYLDFVDDVIDVLTQYKEVGTNQDESLSDYDKTCDILAVRDGFKDLENTLNEVNRQVAIDRDIETHFNDADYDPQVN